MRLSLGQRMAELGAKGMVRVLSALEQGGLVAATTARGGASHTPRSSPVSWVRLDWREPAFDIA